MTCTQSQALQGPDILARFRHVDFRLLESRGISRKTSYLPGNYDRNSVKRGLKTVELRATPPSVGRNSVRINFDREKLTQITGIQCDDRNSSPVGHYNDSAEKYCWNQRCPKWSTDHGSVTANALAILPENAVPHSLQKVPKSAGIRWNSGGHWQRGREFGGAPIQTPPNPTDLVEFGGARGIGRGKQSDPPKAETKTESYILPLLRYTQVSAKPKRNRKKSPSRMLPARTLATVMENPSTDSVKESLETVEFSPRLTPWEGIQPKIVIHPRKPPEFTPRTGIQPNRINSPQWFA
ncbi:hypothetical protein R3P38DRAFT_2768372 [Favolaschia claudopus]|uniref:Uncharacterized protein n=1 Tax=Favolaschia claudopus TaxID=2862362 RepID=A0AAW0CT92_9AGAR